MNQDLPALIVMTLAAGAALALVTAAVTWRTVLATVLLGLALAVAFGAVVIGT